MPDRRGRAPAWYLDPADPTSVRHWDGRGWEGTRSRPAWSLTTGELVVDTEGRLDPTKPGSGPVLEGPVRQAPERATTAALNVGGDLRRVRQTAALRPPSAMTGARAGQFPAMGGSNAFAGRPPWATTRRPVAVIALIVVIALVAMVVVVSLARPHRLTAGEVPSSFVTRASQTCGILGNRSGDLPATADDIKVQDDQLGGVANQLRSLANGTGATPEVTGWLDDWGVFIAAEKQRATVLPPAVPKSGSPTAAQLGQQARTASNRADAFAAANGLRTCSILGSSAPQTLSSVPS